MLAQVSQSAQFFIIWVRRNESGVSCSPAAAVLALLVYFSWISVSSDHTVYAASWQLPFHAVLTEAFLQVLTQACKYFNSYTHPNGAWLFLVLDPEPPTTWKLGSMACSSCIWADTPAVRQPCIVCDTFDCENAKEPLLYVSFGEQWNRRKICTPSLHWYRTDFALLCLRFLF